MSRTKGEASATNGVSTKGERPSKGSR
jgi:hypothetical protein